MRVVVLVLATLSPCLLQTASGQDYVIAPARLGAFVRDDIEDGTIGARDRDLFSEYGLQAACRAKYTDSQQRRLILDLFRFADSEGAHAAFLCSRPARGVSPMIWHIAAVTGGGVTVMEFRNYMLRFHGAIPSISSSLEEMLSKLPDLAAPGSTWDLGSRYIDALSTRAILGKVSLERFAPRIPLSIAGFWLGAKGRLAEFETPAGRVTAVALQYTTEDVANDRAKAFAKLPNASVRVDRTCVGVVFGQANLVVEDAPLSGYFCEGDAATWDPASMTHGDMDLGDSMRGVVFGGLIFGTAIAALRRLNREGDPFPERMTFLRLR